MKFYSLHTRFSFGKYQGKTLEDVILIQSSYIEWCSVNLDHFYIDNDVISRIKEILPSFSLSMEAKQILNAKYHQWEEKQNYFNDNSYVYYERESYGEFAGTYAQDVEGLSDDFIYDVLDGDPDAYWNID
jgi:hypothetical protein